MKYLVVFSIAPVQAFISRARKLRDFYVGSKILSHLASVGFNAAKSRDGFPIYPLHESDSMPNKFVLTLEAQDTEQVKAKAVEIEQEITKAWLELADITNVPKDIVDDYWNYSWAAAQYQSENEYQTAHSKAQKLLAATKLKPRNIRKSQKDQKCPLCGENSVWKDDFRTDKKEKLCGICAIKRLLPEVSISKNHQLYGLFSDKYPSVTEIAMHGYIKKHNLSKEEIESLQEEANYSALKDKYGELPSDKEKYYALLAMDGDRMGDFVNSKTKPSEHKQLAEKLNDFTKSVDKLIEENTSGIGRLIYAGGDDVFAVLPLEYAIETVKAIRELYAREVGSTSISAAIVIAHHKEPMREVIRETHVVLDDIAKKKADRNALAIRLKKRSGGDRDLFFKWCAENPFDSSETLFDSLKKVIEVLSEKEMTSSLIYRLAQLKEAIEVKGIKREQILKLFEYEVACSVDKEKVSENAKKLAGLCLAQAFNKKGKLNDRKFNPEAVVIAHFLAKEQ